MKSPIKARWLVGICLILISAACSTSNSVNESPQFNGDRAFQDLEYQVNLGARVLGSDAHQQVRDWIIETSVDLGWFVEVQNINVQGQEIYNIIVKREINPELPWVIIGAHYDSRKIADQDPLFENRAEPVPGANDGASGVSVLLELARVIPENIGANIWLVFFDAEDNGGLAGGEWDLGSRAFVESLEGNPEVVVIVDMIGDSDLNIFIEKNSDQILSNEIWEIADNLGYEDYFIPYPKYRMIDDHLPFIQAGITAIVIIDFDYPYWHTLADTIDKVSAESIDVVGDVLLTWLIDRYGNSPAG